MSTYDPNENSGLASRIQREEKPLLDDLAKVGIYVSSVWDLVNTSSDYRVALSILAHHLQEPYSDILKEGIARSLALKQANPYWQILLQEYKAAKVGYGLKYPGGLVTDHDLLSAKMGLAAALSAAASEGNIDDLIELALDSSNGDSRLLFLRNLRRAKSPSAREALSELVKDPILQREILSWSKTKSKRPLH